MMMRLTIDVIPDFSSGYCNFIYHPFPGKQLQGIINRGFGHCRNPIYQFIIDHLHGWMHQMRMKIFQNAQPLIGGLDSLLFQFTFNMFHVCNHYIINIIPNMLIRKSFSHLGTYSGNSPTTPRVPLGKSALWDRVSLFHRIHWVDPEIHNQPRLSPWGIHSANSPTKVGI